MGINDITCCAECKFVGKEEYHGAHIWCKHPKAMGTNLPNRFNEIHPDCPIKTVQVIKHADGEYARNVSEIFKEKHAESVNYVLFEAFKAAATDDIGCIVYVFDRSEAGGGTGFNSKNCDAGDAMVAIKRIARQFGIDLEVLAFEVMARSYR